MKKISVIFLLLLLSLSTVLVITWEKPTKANPNDKPPSLEDGYAQFGYISVEEAVTAFENHFKQDVKLPKIKPSIPFT